MPARRDTPAYLLPDSTPAQISITIQTRWGRERTVKCAPTLEQWKERFMTDANPLTQPLVVAANGHFPAGWVSPSEHERVQRELHGLAVDLEREAAEAAERDAEIDRRMTAAREAGNAPVVVSGDSPAE